jgi:hypothetical protein
MQGSGLNIQLKKPASSTVTFSPYSSNIERQIENAAALEDFYAAETIS